MTAQILTFPKQYDETALAWFAAEALRTEAPMATILHFPKLMTRELVPVPIKQNQFNEMQLNWARNHDWFVKELPGGKIVVREFGYKYDTGETIEDIFTFGGTFAELREWAGY